MKMTKILLNLKKNVQKLQEQQKNLLAAAEKIGFKTDLIAINPLDEKIKVPVYFANFVLMDYGLGAVFGCPAHDQRDLDFAKKYKLKINTVVTPEKKIKILRLLIKLIQEVDIYVIHLF